MELDSGPACRCAALSGLVDPLAGCEQRSSLMPRGAAASGLSNRATPEAATDLLRLLFLRTRHKIELRALPSKKRIFTRDLTEAGQFIEAHRRENVYFGVATRDGGGTKEHCREVPALWADLDYRVTSEAEARNRLAAFPLAPTVTIASGGGLHPYWLLSQPCDAHDSHLEPILRGLALHLRGDAAAAEIARIMRLPGTLNHKYQPPTHCRIEEANLARLYALPDFAPYALLSAPKRKPPPGSTVGERIREGGRHPHLCSSRGCFALKVTVKPRSRPHC